jgi:hypothetical protein
LTATRDEHLAWCKREAMAYWNAGDLKNAVASMMSDMGKHPETSGHSPVLDELAFRYLLDEDAEGVRRWIEGFR